LQRRWRERTGQQALRDPLVDRHAVDAEPFREDGGVRRLNRIFEGRLEGTSDEIHGGDWRDTR
jgi:type I restriction enzyme, R subunit